MMVRIVVSMTATMTMDVKVRPDARISCRHSRKRERVSTSSTLLLFRIITCQSVLKMMKGEISSTSEFQKHKTLCFPKAQHITAQSIQTGIDGRGSHSRGGGHCEFNDLAR